MFSVVTKQHCLLLWVWKSILTIRETHTFRVTKNSGLENTWTQEDLKHHSSTVHNQERLHLHGKPGVLRTVICRRLQQIRNVARLRKNKEYNVYIKDKKGDRTSPRHFRYIRFEDEVEYSAAGMWPIADTDITSAQPASFSKDLRVSLGIYRQCNQQYKSCAWHMKSSESIRMKATAIYKH
jgi:hypothetical protein